MYSTKYKCSVLLHFTDVIASVLTEGITGSPIASYFFTLFDGSPFISCPMYYERESVLSLGYVQLEIISYNDIFH